LYILAKVKEIVQTIPRQILAKIYKWKVIRCSIMKFDEQSGNLGGSTSKIHTFNPPVEIPEAVSWLIKFKFTDGALFFENEISQEKFANNLFF